MIRNLNCSIDLPLEEQYKENWGWEDSRQRYELDCEFQDKMYFEDLDPEELINLVRKMDNFLMERGISDYFLRNFALASQVFDELCKEENVHHDSEYYFE